MNRRVLGVLILFLAGATVAWSVMAAEGPRPHIITVDQLRNMLESSERGNMIIVDVRVASS